MGNLNKVMLIGRLTREPEVTEFKNGGKVANFGFAVHNRRLNAQTGEWEETPVWLNMKAYNHDHGRRLADLAGMLHKGRQVYVDGHLVLEQWDGKEDGKHHSKLLVYVDGIEFLGEKPHTAGGAAAGAAGTGADGGTGGEPVPGDGEQAGAEAPGPVDHAPGEHVADAGWPEEEAAKPAKARRRK